MGKLLTKYKGYDISYGIAAYDGGKTGNRTVYFGVITKYSKTEKNQHGFSMIEANYEMEWESTNRVEIGRHAKKLIDSGEIKRLLRE